MVVASKSTVRWLVAGEILLVIIALSIEAPWPYSAFGGGWGVGKWSDQAPLLGWPLLFFGVAAYAGVCQFKSWGRTSYLIYHLLDLFSILVPGVVHMPLLGAVFYGVGYLVAVIVLYLLYFTPLKAQFKKVGAAPEPASLEAPAAANEARLAMADEMHPEEEKTAPPGEKIPDAAQNPEEKNLVDRFTDWIFPRTAEARMKEEPPEQRRKRRSLLLEHYVFILFLVFVIMLTEFRIDGLVIAALCFMVYNLAQRKGTPFTVLFPVLFAAYCLVPIAFSLFGYLLSDFSKDFLLYLIPYVAGWLLLLLLEVSTHKFIRDCNQPLRESAKGDVPKS